MDLEYALNNFCKHLRDNHENFTSIIHQSEINPIRDNFKMRNQEWNQKVICFFIMFYSEYRNIFIRALGGLHKPSLA